MGDAVALALLRQPRRRGVEDRLEEGVLERIRLKERGRTECSTGGSAQLMRFLVRTSLAHLPLVVVELEHAAVAEAEVLVKARAAEPVTRGDFAQRRREALHMEAALAAVAQQHRPVPIA